MAKDNLFLGFGRGSVGDVVFYRANGQQVSRARNRSPKNPQSPLQLLQRVVTKTTAMAFSLLQEICNHSFQGYAEGTPNQSRFMKLNVARFREQLSAEINSGDPDDILGSASSNFATKQASQVEFNPYIISEGSLGTIAVQWGDGLQTPNFMVGVNLGTASPSYSDVVAALGLQAGDQLTFIALSIDDTTEGGQFNGFKYCRVILEPDGGNMSVPFLSGGAINDPNEKNQGSFTFAISQLGSTYHLTFIPAEFAAQASRVNSIAAAAVIVSRNNGNVWARSSQSLVLRSDLVSVTGHLNYDHGTDYLGDAIQSFMSDESSTLYLNQAVRSIGLTDVGAPAITSTTIGGSAVPSTGHLNIDPGSAVVSATMANAVEGVTYQWALKLGTTYSLNQPFVNGSFSNVSKTFVANADNYKIVLLADGVEVGEFGEVFVDDGGD